MRPHSRSQSLSVSIKPYLQRVLFATLLLASLFFLYAERQGQSWVESIRMALLEASAPVSQLIASPVAAVEDLSARWHNMWQIYSENRQLQHDNAQLLEWRAAALRLETENESLRRLLQYQPDMRAHYITAKAVSPAGGSLAHRLQLNAGLGEGIRRHLPVVNEHGLVGRVLHVSPEHAEILLLTDMSSRIPVTLQPSGVKALLIGDHYELPYLKLANPKEKPALGDVVMTSDDGDLLPGGLYIGKLFAARDDRYEVLPAFKDEPINFVRIIDTP